MNERLSRPGPSITYRHWLLVLLILIVCSAPSAELQFDRQPAHPGAYASLEYILDGSGQHGIDDVLSLGDTAWKPVGGPGASFGYDDAHYWFRWHMPADPRQAPEQRYIEIAYPMLDEIDIFVIRRQDGRAIVTQQWHLGDKLPFAQRPVSHRNFVVPFETDPHSDLEFIARVHTTSALQFPVRMWRTADFERYDQVNLLATGVFTGIMFSILLYNLVLWLTMGERLYLYFVLWVTFILLTVTTLEGLGFQYLWPENMIFNEHSMFFGLPLGAASALAFTCEFLYTEAERPNWTRNLPGAVFVLAIVQILTSFALPYRTAITMDMLLVIASTIVSFGIGLAAAFRGQTHARLFVAGFFGVLAVVGMVVLGKLSMTSEVITSDSLIKIAFGIESILISLSLAMRMSEEHRLREEAQQALIEAQRNACSQLEQHVAERTRQLEMLNRELSRLSITDPLTGLPNRRYLDEVLATEAARAVALGRPFSMAMIDVDRFKVFNDSYGHAAGDQCLRAVATELRRQVPRKGDLVARFGGEEFCVLMPNTDADGAVMVAERIRRGMQGVRVDLGDALVGVTVSVGVHTIRPADAMQDMRKLIEIVDQALYRAKALGRNRVVEASTLTFAADPGNTSNCVAC